VSDRSLARATILVEVVSCRGFGPFSVFHSSGRIGSLAGPLDPALIALETENMSTVTESALRALLRDPSNFHFDDYVEVVERGYYDGNLDEVRRTYGFATRTATCGDLRVVLSGSFDYERMPRTLRCRYSGIDDASFGRRDGQDDDGRTRHIRHPLNFLGAPDDFTAMTTVSNSRGEISMEWPQRMLLAARTGEANMVSTGSDAEPLFS